MWTENDGKARVESFNSARGKEGDWSRECHRGDTGFPVNNYVSAMEPRRGCENGKTWPLPVLRAISGYCSLDFSPSRCFRARFNM